MRDVVGEVAQAMYDEINWQACCGPYSEGEETTVDGVINLRDLARVALTAIMSNHPNWPQEVGEALK